MGTRMQNGHLDPVAVVRRKEPEEGHEWGAPLRLLQVVAGAVGGPERKRHKCLFELNTNFVSHDTNLVSHDTNLVSHSMTFVSHDVNFVSHDIICEMEAVLHICVTRHEFCVARHKFYALLHIKNIKTFSIRHSVIKINWEFNLSNILTSLILYV
jgi:hypothetical protein